MSATATDEDEVKVYVSRLPHKWSDMHLKEHFEACFGPVQSASVTMDPIHHFSMGFGFVTFVNSTDRDKAIEQGSLHAKKRTIQIRPIVRKDDNKSAATSAIAAAATDGICFLWKKKACVRGDFCKFKHEGEGGCIEVSAPGTGKTKKCISFKTKGKCSKGSDCPFLHISSKASASASSSSSSAAPSASTEGPEAVVSTGSNSKPKVEGAGVCHTFQKKGKCRKGDACKFSHVTAAGTVAGSASASAAAIEADQQQGGKRRRIDGAELVKNRKKMLLAEERE